MFRWQDAGWFCGPLLHKNTSCKAANRRAAPIKIAPSPCTHKSSTQRIFTKFDTWSSTTAYRRIQFPFRQDRTVGKPTISKGSHVFPCAAPPKAAERRKFITAQPELNTPCCGSNRPSPYFPEGTAKFTLQQTTKAQRWSIVIVLLFL